MKRRVLLRMLAAVPLCGWLAKRAAAAPTLVTVGPLKTTRFLGFISTPMTGQIYDPMSEPVRLEYRGGAYEIGGWRKPS